MAGYHTSGGSESTDVARRFSAVQVGLRQANYYSHWNTDDHSQLQSTLQTLRQEFNQCATKVQSMRSANEEIKNKAEVANKLLEDIELASVNLKSCIDEGGDTYADQSTLSKYTENGGSLPLMIPPPQTTRRPQPIKQIDYSIYHAPAPPTSFRPYVFGRRTAQSGNTDWSQVIAQRAQWKAFAEQAVIKCWATLGRLPDGSFPPSTTSTRPPKVGTAPSIQLMKTPAPPPPPTQKPASEAKAPSPTASPPTTASPVYITSTTGSGLTTTFAPMLTTAPC